MPVTQSDIIRLTQLRDNAKISVDAAYVDMSNWFNVIKGCKIKDGTLILGEYEEGECQTGSANNYPGCASQSTCNSNKAIYNSKVANWEQRQNDYDIAQGNLDDARDELEGKQQGEIDTNIARLEEEAKNIRMRYYLFGGLAIVVIGAIIFLIVKLKKK